MKKDAGWAAWLSPPKSVVRGGCVGWKWRMGGGLPSPRVPVAEQGVLGLVPTVVGVPAASVEQTQPRHQLGSGGFMLTWVRGLCPTWGVFGPSCPTSKRVFSSSHADKKLPLPLHSSFCPA